MFSEGYTEGSSVVSFEVKSESIRSKGTVWEGMMSEHILFKHKLTTKLLDRVMYSSTGESKTLLFVLCLEGNKEDSSVIATEGMISAAEGNKCPEVIVWIPISAYQLANTTEFIQNVS